MLSLSCEDYPLPLACPHMRIGLFGGSFDPPHEGHLAVSGTALKRLKLDQVWWLVSPGNPLKEAGPWPLEKRLLQCRKLTASHPGLKVTGAEKCRLPGTGQPVFYSVDTLAWLVQRFPRTDFVWIMGADNLASFHKWHKWRQIFDLVPVLVVDRPGYRVASQGALVSRRMEQYRLKDLEVSTLPQARLPAWAHIVMPLQDISSTKIREKHKAKGTEK